MSVEIKPMRIEYISLSEHDKSGIANYVELSVISEEFGRIMQRITTPQEVDSLIQSLLTSKQIAWGIIR